jgi:dUTP pyrophosphatase
MVPKQPPRIPNESNVTEWLKLERLAENDLPIPRYESDHSAGVDFSACLTRPCRLVPEGGTFKESRPFVCCDPTQEGAHLGGMTNLSPDNNHIIMSNKRLRIDPDGDWNYIKASIVRLIIWPGETIMIPLGFKCEFGESYVLMLHVRSSIGMRGLELANQTGIIDPDYRGELFAVVYNRNKQTPIVIEHGDRIVQGVMLGFNQAIITEAEVDQTERGEGGFGSTGVSAHHEDFDVEGLPTRAIEGLPSESRPES